MGRRKKEKEKKVSPTVEDVLNLLVSGVCLSALFLFPAAGAGIKAIYDVYEEMKKKKTLKELEKYDLSRLRYTLKRLQKQKIVQTGYENGYSVVRLTEKGRMRTFQYQLENMKIEKPLRWDGKWRLIMYDIAKFKRREQAAFREMLKRLKMLPLQKSVYLTPYPCKDEIEFLREYFQVGEGVLYGVVESFEHQEEFKKYFGL